MKELLKKMNTALEVFANTRITDFGEFHKQVEQIITPLLPKELRVGTWVVGTRNINLSTDVDAFKLEMEFIDDKNAKIGSRRGRMVKCWYEQNYKGNTLPEIIKNENIATLAEGIIEQKKYLKSLKQDILNGQAHLKHLQDRHRKLSAK